MSSSSQPILWRDRIKVHPAADLFPIMSGEELDALAADMTKNGPQQSCMWFKSPDDDEPGLIDGRNRIAAAHRIADEQLREQIISWFLRFRNMVPADKDPWDFVVSVNLYRRHLTTDQRREVAVKYLKANPGRSDRAIAKLVKLSDKTVGGIRRGLESRAEIPHVAARTDSKGRRQPASKPPTLGVVTAKHDVSLSLVTAGPPKAVEPRVTVHSACPPRSAMPPKMPADQVRAKALMQVSTILKQQPARTLEDLVKILGNARRQIAGLPVENRVILMRGFLIAHSLTPDDVKAP